MTVSTNNKTWQPPSDEPLIRIEKVSKTFGAAKAVDDINLTIHKGEFFSLLGPSGCGKTTLLRMLAGFETPTSGRILINGEDVTTMPAFKRQINMMFQSYALFPHMTVADNIAFGLKQEHMPRAERTVRVNEVMELVQITPFAKRKPDQLSGGQRQRVALARALAKQPKILLLDEPLGALDKKLREKTQFELVNLQERLGITFIIVTHDQEEAMTMSTRIALMHNGYIEQIDTPRRLYEFPQSRYAANFLGSINLFNGHVKSQEGDQLLVHCSETDTLMQVRHSEPLTQGMEVSIAIRPEKIRLIPSELSNKANEINGIIQDIAYLGDVSIYHVQLDSGKKVMFTQSNTQALAEQPLHWEQRVTLSWSPNTASILTQ